MPRLSIDHFYMGVAKEAAELSYCERRKVGAVIVKDGNILSFGYNGNPSGMSNECEENGVTKDTVLHAESNAILKCARDTKSTEGATLYLTLSPCIHCAKLIIQSGIENVFYDQVYRDTSGLDLLSQAKINHQILKNGN